MNRRKKRSAFFSVLLVFCVLSMLFQTVWAVPAVSGAPVAPAQPDLSVHQESFSGDYAMKGLFSSFTESFSAGDWNISEAKLTLRFAVTPLVRQEVSDFTVSFNGQRFYSSRIPLTKGQQQTIEIPLPVEQIKSGSNSLLVETYLRTTESDPCSEDVSQSSWMSVSRDSFVTLRYTSLAKIDTVADFYRQFTSIDALENRQSAVYVASALQESELTAASWVLSGVSKNAAMFYENLELLYDSQNSAFRPYSVYVCGYAKLPPRLAGLLSAEQKQAAEKGAVLALVRPTPDQAVLVVTGADSAALVNAGRLFGNADYITQTSSLWRPVTAKETVTFQQEEEGTTQKLTETGTMLNGPFHQEQTYFIRGAGNRILDPGSQVDLVFRYSENLDFNRSLVTVYLNDMPIGSKKLTKQGAQGDTARFYLPVDVEIYGNFNLKVAFDLEIPDLYCTMRQEEMPWAYVTSDSTVTLVSKDSPYLLLEYYPEGFLEDGAMNHLTFVLPDQPQQSELTVLGKTAVAMGRYTQNNSGTMRACTVSEMGNLANENIISIGRFERNAIAQKYRDQMFFRFSEDGSRIVSNEKLQIEPGYGATLGTIQLLNSPYQKENRALLLVTGVTDESMLRAAEYISNSQELWKLKGDGFLVDDATAHFYRFKQDNAKAVPFSQKLSGTPGLPSLILAGSGVLILLAVAAVFLYLKHRKRGDR